MSNTQQQFSAGQARGEGQVSNFLFHPPSQQLILTVDSALRFVQEKASQLLQPAREKASQATQSASESKEQAAGFLQQVKCTHPTPFSNNYNTAIDSSECEIIDLLNTLFCFFSMKTADQVTHMAHEAADAVKNAVGMGNNASSAPGTTTHTTTTTTTKRQ